MNKKYIFIGVAVLVGLFILADNFAPGLLSGLGGSLVGSLTDSLSGITDAVTGYLPGGESE